jgi:hypothetical protein
MRHWPWMRVALVALLLPVPFATANAQSWLAAVGAGATSLSNGLDDLIRQRQQEERATRLAQIRRAEIAIANSRMLDSARRLDAQSTVFALRAADVIQQARDTLALGAVADTAFAREAGMIAATLFTANPLATTPDIVELLTPVVRRYHKSVMNFSAHYYATKDGLENGLPIPASRRSTFEHDAVAALDSLWQRHLDADYAAFFLIMSPIAEKYEAPGTRKRLEKTRALQRDVAADTVGSDVYYAFNVEHPATAYPGNRTPTFPPKLMKTGKTYHVVVRYVVDTLGHAQANSFRVIGKSPPALTMPTWEAVVAGRYHPATISGHRVKQLVQQEFTFQAPAAQPKS